MSVKRYSVGVDGIDPNGNLVKYEDYAALEARCAALAAELNEIKVAVMARMKLHEEIRNAGRPPHTDFWHQSIYMADKRVDDSLSSTPNHDAFLAEVRAQGVDALVERRLTAARLAKEAGHEITARDLEGEAIRARIFAMELRKGVQS